jgi:putative colanic acid biosynthesis acetyltransferase WcaF
MNLSKYNNKHFNRGRPKIWEFFWLITQTIFINSWIPGSWIRIQILKFFGAKIGNNVVMKPNIRIKFPWRLEINDNVWIGESVWIDNIAKVKIDRNVCISQGVYLCTGNHNYTSKNFNLIFKEIIISEQVWIGANAILAPGTYIEKGVVVTLGSIVSGNLKKWSVYSGFPAKRIKKRNLIK